MEIGRILHVENHTALEKFLDSFLEEARTRLDKVRNSLPNLSQEKSDLYKWAKEEKTYPLMCAFAQKLMVYNLEDNSFIGKPFASDAIKESPFSHCAASMPVKIGTTKESLHVMLDPTYTQFSLPSNLYPAFGLREIQSRHSPLSFLQETKEGQEFWNNIKEKGYFIITPETAKLYVESLCPRFSIAKDDAYRALAYPAFYQGEKEHNRTRLSEQGCLGIDLHKMLNKSEIIAPKAWGHTPAPF